MRILFIEDETALTLSGFIFLKNCFRLLKEKYPSNEWMSLQFQQTDTAASIIWMRLKRKRKISSFKPDLIIGPVALTDYYPANIPLLLYCPERKQFKGITLKQLKKAAKIFVNFHKMKMKLVEDFGFKSENILVIRAAPDEGIKPADWQDKFVIKNEFASGKEFILIQLSIDENSNWEDCLKAFSIFKKWQQTEMQLVMFCHIKESFQKKFEEKIHSYKYRSDLQVYGNYEAQTFNKLLPACYCLIIPYGQDASGIILLNAFTSGVPVIVEKEDDLIELSDDAIMTCEFKPDELSEKMILLYKNESVSAQLVENGKKSAGHFTWEETVGLLYEMIISFGSFIKKYD